MFTKFKTKLVWKLARVLLKKSPVWNLLRTFFFNQNVIVIGESDHFMSYEHNYKDLKKALDICEMVERDLKRRIYNCGNFDREIKVNEPEGNR